MSDCLFSQFVHSPCRIMCGCQIPPFRHRN